MTPEAKASMDMIAQSCVTVRRDSLEIAGIRARSLLFVLDDKGRPPFACLADGDEDVSVVSPGASSLNRRSASTGGGLEAAGTDSMALDMLRERTTLMRPSRA